MPSLVVKLSLTFWVSGKNPKVDEEQYTATFNWGLIQENMTKSSQWFLRELHHFSSPWKGEQSTNMASPPRLCKHGMALITDAYFGVTSEAASLLFVSLLCFPVWAPSSLRESTCKEYYSVLKGLSSQGVALSLLYASGPKLIAARGTKWLFLFYVGY